MQEEKLLTWTFCNSLTLRRLLSSLGSTSTIHSHELLRHGHRQRPLVLEADRVRSLLGERLAHNNGLRLRHWPICDLGGNRWRLCVFVGMALGVHTLSSTFGRIHS